MKESENYIGESLSDHECDFIALSRFTRTLFAGEVELQQRCWFDYRYLHPIKRTYLFADHYMRCFKASYAKYIDADCDHIIGISRPNDPLDNRPTRNKTAKLRTPTFLIKARQVADALCMPYDFFIATGLDFVMNDRFYKALLGYNRDSKMRLHIQASSLYNENTIAHIQHQWEEIGKYRIRWSENPRLCFTQDEMIARGQDCAHPYKIQHERYLAKRILTKTHKVFAVEKALAKCFLRNSTAERILSLE